VLGVVMRTKPAEHNGQKFVRRLWVFVKDRIDADVPTSFTLWSRPRGLFKVHGVDSCDGVECSICGARNMWTPSKESFDTLVSHFQRKEKAQHETV
jgi:hypothetical protein